MQYSAHVFIRDRALAKRRVYSQNTSGTPVPLLNTDQTPVPRLAGMVVCGSMERAFGMERGGNGRP